MVCHYVLHQRQHANEFRIKRNAKSEHKINRKKIEEPEIGFFRLLVRSSWYVVLFAAENRSTENLNTHTRVKQHRSIVRNKQNLFLRPITT